MTDLNDFKYKLTQFTTENEQLRKKLQEAGDLQRRLSEYERKIEQLTGEVRNEAGKRDQMTR
jgi:tetrahydromethanopterin S-methyltransferase subunit G